MTLQIAHASLSTQEEEDVGRAESLWREKHPESLDSALMRSLLLVDGEHRVLVLLKWIYLHFASVYKSRNPL